jgi:hypothetical protein
MSKNNIFLQNKVFFWLAVGTSLLLLIPLIAMQFSSEVNWNLTDFIVMGVLLFGFGSGFILVSRRVSQQYRLLVGLILLVFLIWIWAELAVGVFTSWGN